MLQLIEIIFYLLYNAYNREEAEINFNCINLDKIYKELSQQQIFSVTNQITNRFDFNSLLKFNKTDFIDFPLMLEELTS